MKRQLAWLSLLLCALLLTGCVSFDSARTADPEPAEAVETRAEACDFDDMAYERPDIESFTRCVEQAKEAILAGAEDAVSLEDACWDEFNHFSTMYSLANIRACQDTSDEYYAAEFAWCSDSYAIVLQLLEELDYAWEDAPVTDQTEPDYDLGDYDLGDYDLEGRVWAGPIYNDESVELMRRESALVSEYRRLTGEAMIELDGGSGSLDAYYRKYNPQLAQLYISLVQTRQELAAIMGYDSYEQMQYSYYFERDYSPQQAEAYIEDIRTYILPLYLQALEADCYSDYDANSDYFPEARLMRAMGEITWNMGGELEEAYGFMARYRLYDIERRLNKSDSSFQSYVQDYDAPFLFLSTYEVLDDLLTFAHEFGHYVDSYVNLNAGESTDLAECYSQSMEYLMLCYLEEAVSERDAESLRQTKLMDTLDMYITQAYYAQFEHRVYAMDSSELSVESLNALSLELAEQWGGAYAYSDMSWIDVNHFFEQPFYVISYPVSNDVAMQIYAMELDSPGAGLAKFKELLHRESFAMIETVEAAGLTSPLAPGRVEKTGELLRELLAEY